MTVRYEGAGANDTFITVAQAGEEIGADVVPEGQIALCFNYDEVFYIQGKPADLLDLLDQARFEVQKSTKEDVSPGG